MTIMKWFETHANHLLHCSIYTGAAAYALKCGTRSISSASSNYWNTMLHVIFAAVAALNLGAEINFMFQRAHLPPGNSGSPLFGHALVWIQGTREFLTRRLRRLGGPFTYNVLMTPWVFFTSEEDVRWAITQERKGNLVPAGPDYLLELLGREALLLQASTNHRRLRRVLEPAFSPAALKDCVQLMDETIKTELEKWSIRDDFWPATEWAMLAMRQFFRCTFGNISEDRLGRVVDLFATWEKGFTAWVPICIPGNCLHSAHVARKGLSVEIQSMIDKFRMENGPGSPGAKNSMMGRLCYGLDDNGLPLTDEQLTQNIVFVLFAGHDTMKGSFGAFAHFLVEHPRVRDMLVVEVQSFTEPLDYNELKAAPLLNAFMAETWRLVPPTDSHKLEARIDLEYKGYKIRKGVGVATDITCENIMNETRFPDPLEFRIERWLPKDHPLHDSKYCLENVDYNVMSVKYRAFNLGPHQCLGAHFAKLEARIALTRLLQSYDIEIQNDKLLTAIPLLHYTNDFKIITR